MAAALPGRKAAGGGTVRVAGGIQVLQVLAQGQVGEAACNTACEASELRVDVELGVLGRLDVPGVPDPSSSSLSPTRLRWRSRRRSTLRPREWRWGRRSGRRLSGETRLWHATGLGGMGGMGGTDVSGGSNTTAGLEVTLDRLRVFSKSASMLTRCRLPPSPDECLPSLLAFAGILSAVHLAEPFEPFGRLARRGKTRTRSQSESTAATHAATTTATNTSGVRGANGADGVSGGMGGGTVGGESESSRRGAARI
jgi:hypothetical protein